MNDRMYFTLSSYIFQTGTFIILNLLLWFIGRNGYFLRYKIQQRKAPSDALVLDCFQSVVLFNLAAFPLIYFIVYPLYNSIGLELNVKSDSFFWLISLNLFFLLSNETVFYFGHRLLHMRKPLDIYRSVHRKHHLFITPIGISSEYAAVEENLINLIALNSGPIMISLLFGHLHINTWLIWIALRTIETIDGHSGYNFPFSPFRILEGAERHDYHHSHITGNYGTFLHIWDTLLQTDTSFKIWKMKQRAKSALEA